MSCIPYEIGSYYVFDRGYNAFIELFRINRLESFFVVRAKQNLQYKSVKWKRRLPKNVLGDAVILLTKEATFRKYPEKLRLVRFHEPTLNRDFAFLTNDFTLHPLKVSELYKNRWQVELFFKWLKQHLKIKKFWGTTENAVRIQVSVAVITCCLVAMVHKKMKLRRSPYEMLQILSMSLTDKTPLQELFEKTEPDVSDKDDDTPFLPGLFE